MARILTLSRVLGGAMLAAVACGESQPSPAPAAQSAPAPAPAPTDTADGPGTIVGAVTFAGTPRSRGRCRWIRIRMCVTEPGATSELLVVGPGNGIKKSLCM